MTTTPRTLTDWERLMSQKSAIERELTASRAECERLREALDFLLDALDTNDSEALRLAIAEAKAAYATTVVFAARAALRGDA